MVNQRKTSDDAEDEDFENNHADNDDGGVDEEVRMGSPVGNKPSLC